MKRVSASTRFLELWAEIEDLGKVAEVLAWDAETKMPVHGVEARGSLQGTVAGLAHAKLTGDELFDVLQRAEEEAGAEPEGVLAAQLRVAGRLVRRKRRIPGRLAREQARSRTTGHAAWAEARAKDDFELFREPLIELVTLAREEAQALSEDFETPYDALMDEFEPGVCEADLEPLFARLADALTPLVRAVSECGRPVDESPAKGHFPMQAQRAFGLEVAQAMGFSFEAGRLDRAVHPFCSGFAPGDVRITWRWNETDFRSGLFGIMHEAGHGLYEQGLPKQWQRTPIGNAVSLGVHESQSRMWENVVGRSRAFWTWALPRFKQHFPDKRGLELDRLLPCLRTVKPSLIRVEADEGTYDLHVIARFEVERALFAGRIEVGDLPECWDAAYDRLLGMHAPGPALGVLQDVHWSFGSFGYFPTYTLGNLIMAQLFSAARAELGDLDEAHAQGEFRPLLDWLRENVHRHGSRYTTAELVERATGRALAADDYLAIRARAVEEVYGVSA